MRRNFVEEMQSLDVDPHRRVLESKAVDALVSSGMKRGKAIAFVKTLKDIAIDPQTGEILMIPSK
jgi:hypothetical protein